MTGEDLPLGQILAEEGQKGVTREIHAQGWYFFNKLTHRAEVSKVTEVGTDQICILKQESGDPLPEGRILAPVRRQPDGTIITNAMGLPESQFKGELEEYLGPGKYRIHPYMYKVKLGPWSQVGAGQVGVLTKLDGLPLPAGEFIAPVKRDQQGQVLLKDGIPQSDYKGILEEVLKPGNYRVHPGLYKFETIPAVQAEAGFVGVVTARTGAPTPEGQLLASEGQRGVQEKVLSPGTYYLNPAMYTVDLVSIQSHIAEFLDDKGAAPLAEVIDFPSNDGFHIKIDVAVEWRINADKVAEVFTRLGNIKEIETEVVIPNTRSIARVEGSTYNAKDFIQGEAANTSFVWLPANEGTFWGGTLDDLQKWLVKHQRTPQAEQKPSQVGTK
jgi:hypothetical protein